MYLFKYSLTMPYSLYEREIFVMVVVFTGTLNLNEDISTKNKSLNCKYTVLHSTQHKM